MFLCQRISLTRTAWWKTLLITTKPSLLRLDVQLQWKSSDGIFLVKALHKQNPNLSHFQPFGVECWIYVRSEQRNDCRFDAWGVPGIFVGRATSENKPASVIHIPFKFTGTTSRAFVVTNNVVFGHKYPLAPYYMNQSSEGVIDSFPQSASAADLLPGNVSAVDNISNTHLIAWLRNSSLRTISHSQLYANLINAQGSQFTHEYLNFLDRHILF